MICWIVIMNEMIAGESHQRPLRQKQTPAVLLCYNACRAWRTLDATQPE